MRQHRQKNRGDQHGQCGHDQQRVDRAAQRAVVFLFVLQTLALLGDSLGGRDLHRARRRDLSGHIGSLFLIFAGTALLQQGCQLGADLHGPAHLPTEKLPLSVGLPVGPAHNVVGLAPGIRQQLISSRCSSVVSGPAHLSLIHI